MATYFNENSFKLIFELEIKTRETIILMMEKNFGTKWMKQKIPEDIRSKMSDGKKRESELKWTEKTLYHPIYYVDFPDLIKIITKDDNWKSVFVKEFYNKENYMSDMRQLEPIRNKIAHARFMLGLWMN